MRNEMMLAVLLSLASACSESKSDGEGGAGAASNGGAGGEGATSNGGAGGEGATSNGGAANGGAGGEGGESVGGNGGEGPGGAGPTGSVAINEIDAGADWIELYNHGNEAFDLSGLVLADADAGEPKLDEAIEFPEGTSLAPGQRLFILAKQDEVVMPGLQEEQTECDPGTSPCFFAPFGLSSDGDEVFLLDGEDILAAGELPELATADGESWCRIPEGTGEFLVCTPTPGTPNEQ